MTFASPRDLGATWFIGLDYANALGMVGDTDFESIVRAYIADDMPK